SRRRDSPDRHRTLRAAMDWSYDLLAPEAQRFFTLLSVFRGGWTLEAAQEVCDEPLALDYLAQLQECSLVRADADPSDMRFLMLEPVREYAASRLQEAAEGARAMQRNHAAHFLAYARERLARLRTPDEVGALRALEREVGNLRAADEWARSVGAPE